MKTIIRNFLSVLRRFKMATGLNILGLTVAFAAFMVILMQVGYEYNFDRHHKNAKRLYRVDLTIDGIMGTVHSRPFINEFIKSSPHIEMGGLIRPFNPVSYFYIGEGEHKTGFKEEVVLLEPILMKMFDFPVLLGDVDCLEDPEKVMIPESLALKLFGNENPIGKQIHTDENMWLKWVKDFTVGAVYKDLPGNTQLRNGVYTAIAKDADKDQWFSRNYFMYVLLDSPESVPLVVENFNTIFDFNQINHGSMFDPDELGVKMIPLTDIYFRENMDAEWVVRTGSRETAVLLLCIGLFIVIIAAINFTNFSTALTPLRIKSINTQKVLGSSDRVLKMSLLSEAVLISIISSLLAIGLVALLGKVSILTFIEANIRIDNNWPIVGITLLLALIVGLIAGIYPARYITSFPPALVLKGSFGLSPKGKQLRTFLMGFQFVVSIVLMIVSGFVYLQRQYIMNYNVGFDKDQIAVIEVSEELMDNKRDTYVNELKQYPGIEDVAFADDKVGSKDLYSTNMFKYRGEDVVFFQVGVSDNFLSVMGIPLIEGKFSNEKEGKRQYIFTKSVQDQVGLTPGRYGINNENSNDEVVGICENVNLTSLRHGTNNIAFITNNSDYGRMTVSYVRLQGGSDFSTALDHIRKTLKEIDPTYPVEITFYDEVFNELYKKEENLNKMVTLFSLLAVLISIVGVFGLVVFETQYRKKEIGIRKVMGAEVADILLMFNKSYFLIVVSCFVVSVPIAYFSVIKWLENFASKTPVYPWVFALAFLLVALIVILTVTLQNWKAATENPVDSIKTE